MNENAFEKELTALINKYCFERGSNTPDYVLARYIINCLETANSLIRMREGWYGREELKKEFVHD